MFQLDLTSPAFESDDPIPVQYTCDGENTSPPLRWSDPPEDTKSFALVVDDPDAPAGAFVHWVAWNIPADARELPAGASLELQGRNGFGKLGWGGPCPPATHGAHHYQFRLFALDTVLDLDPGATRKDLADAISGRVVAEGLLVGTYERRKGRTAPPSGVPRHPVD